MASGGTLGLETVAAWAAFLDNFGFGLMMPVFPALFASPTIHGCVRGASGLVSGGTGHRSVADWSTVR
jgi:hypothetical protein